VPWDGGALYEGFHLSGPHLPGYVFRSHSGSINQHRHISSRNQVAMLEAHEEKSREGSDVRRVPFFIVLVAVACACIAILRPLLSVIAWAAILTYVSWPLYRWVRRPLGRFESAAAFLMTVILTCVVILPVLWLLASVSNELIDAHRIFASYLAGAPALPDFIRGIPWLGDQLQQQFGRLAGEPNALDAQIADWIQSWSSELAVLAGGVGRSIGKLLLVMFTVFFLYRDGHRLLRQIRIFVTRFFGDRLDSYLATAGAMTRAVMYGFLATAFAQGVIAGIGYAILGIHGAVLLGALTGALSVVPVLGTAIVWGSVSVYLLVTGRLGSAARTSDRQRTSPAAHQQRHPRALHHRHVWGHRRRCRGRARRNFCRARHSGNRTCRVAQMVGGSNVMNSECAGAVEDRCMTDGEPAR
jgi:predicted PurR-regulated permease PerM